MESCQPFSASFKSPVVDKLMSEPVSRNSGSPNKEITTEQIVPVGEASDEFMGILEVFIHQARDIQNICIYHKQDVYAKVCLTSDPEVSLSTHTVNGGGKNPVFNENLRLNVRTVEASLKCEVWMLSRVKNYLEDQLLGFALVPLADIVVGNRKLEGDFTLSSTDLFRSPAGFVQLSLSYHGQSPDVIAISTSPKSIIEDTVFPDAENGGSDPNECEYDKIEFPDLKMVNENEMMVSEYFGIPCTDVNSQSAENLTTDNRNCHSNHEAGVRVVESFVTSDNSADSYGKKDSPQSSVSTNGSSPAMPATSQSFSEPSVVTTSLAQKDKPEKGAEGEANSSAVGLEKTFTPVININIPEHTVVQQDIVDMYMKSMQQFTESLAKMKLPMDVETSSTSTGSVNSGSEEKSPATKGTGSRVFYGSRAFF